MNELDERFEASGVKGVYAKGVYAKGERAAMVDKADEAWAQRCAEVLAQLEDYVWWRFYAHVRSRAQSLHEPGMRALP